MNTLPHTRTNRIVGGPKHVEGDKGVASAQELSQHTTSGTATERARTTHDAKRRSRISALTHESAAAAHEVSFSQKGTRDPYAIPTGHARITLENFRSGSLRQTFPGLGALNGSLGSQVSGGGGRSSAKSYLPPSPESPQRTWTRLGCRRHLTHIAPTRPLAPPIATRHGARRPRRSRLHRTRRQPNAACLVSPKDGQSAPTPTIHTHPICAHHPGATPLLPTTVGPSMA